MAQHFDIPIAFNYSSTKVKWERCAFDLTDEYSVANQKATVPPLVRTIAPESDNVHVRLKRGTGLAALTSKPEPTYKTHSSELIVALGVMFDRQKCGLPLPESMTQIFVTPHSGGLEDIPRMEQVQGTSARMKSTEKQLDPWQMREEFMRLEETNASLLAFLNHWGIWDRSSTLSLAMVPLSGAGVAPYESQFLCVLPFLVWEERRRLRAGIIGKPEAWLTSNASLGMLNQRSSFPYLGITNRECRKAVETTITLDHMRQVKSRICARPDCDNIFTVESDHGKIYCQQYCAHLASVRRKRAAAKLSPKSARSNGV